MAILKHLISYYKCFIVNYNTALQRWLTKLSAKKGKYVQSAKKGKKYDIMIKTNSGLLYALTVQRDNEVSL